MNLRKDFVCGFLGKSANRHFRICPGLSGKSSQVFDSRTVILRTFARKFSNIDFFLKILPLKDDELVMSEMQKKLGVTDFVLE